jgi:hypothetical protein
MAVKNMLDSKRGRYTGEVAESRQEISDIDDSVAAGACLEF